MNAPCFAGPVLVPVGPVLVHQDNEQEVRKEAVRVIEACLNLLGISAWTAGRNRTAGRIESDRVG